MIDEVIVLAAFFVVGCHQSAEILKYFAQFVSTLGFSEPTGYLVYLGHCLILQL